MCLVVVQSPWLVGGVPWLAFVAHFTGKAAPEQSGARHVSIVTGTSRLYVNTRRHRRGTRPHGSQARMRVLRAANVTGNAIVHVSLQSIVSHWSLSSIPANLGDPDGSPESRAHGAHMQARKPDFSLFPCQPFPGSYSDTWVSEIRVPRG